ncbi:MAG: NUDIX domain-containing protein [Nanoarchaeota archaeon]|nr:NUDIX domain-containing protein [Nanoarchaeota archaeon]
MVIKKYRKAVFIVTYSKTKKEIEYLLLKRKLHWDGWEFPKGAIESFETKKRAVWRELLEETGLKPIGKIKKLNYSGEYNYGKILEDRPNFKGQTFALYAVEIKKGKIKLDKKEHSSHKWVSFSRAFKLLKWPNQRKSLKIANSFIVNGKV